MRFPNFSYSAVAAPAMWLAIEILEPDAVKFAADKTTTVLLGLVWDNNQKSVKSQCGGAGLFFLAALALHFLYRCYQIVYPRLRPNRSPEPLLPLFEDRDPPSGMYLKSNEGSSW